MPSLTQTKASLTPPSLTTTVATAGPVSLAQSAVGVRGATGGIAPLNDAVPLIDAVPVLPGVSGGGCVASVLPPPLHELQAATRTAQARSDLMAWQCNRCRYRASRFHRARPWRAANRGAPARP